MRFKLRAENLLEWIALRFNLAPRPLLETQIAFTAARAIMAAADLGLFEALGTSALSADDVARQCGTHAAGTRHLLDCLVGVGYLNWRDGKYSLKPHYRKWLLKASESNLVAKMRFQILEWDYVGRLEDYVRTGQPLDLHGTTSDIQWQTYQEGMRDLSVNAARELAGKIPLPKSATQMLDIGGSHGMYSIELCKRHAALSSTILELPDAIEAASAIAKRYDNTGRVSYAAGNALADDLGESRYDLVMINNVVHHFSADQNRALATKVARALKPDGIYAIGDMIRPHTPGEGGVVASTLDLYFALTSASGNWSQSEMQSWQQGAGLQLLRPLTMMSLPGWQMILAAKR